jgi:hypothetical protein
MNEYYEKAKEIRHAPMVEVWIQERQRIHGAIEDCKSCGFPHNKHILCNQAPFAEIKFGGDSYSISLSNLVWWHDFIQGFVPVGAYHWSKERFFRNTLEGIEVVFFTKYNNHPQRNAWLIPHMEWRTIVEQVSPQTNKKGE